MFCLRKSRRVEQILAPCVISAALLKVDHLQSELSKQYLQYREERDARKLLIWQLNDLTRGSVKDRPADEAAGMKKPLLANHRIRSGSGIFFEQVIKKSA